MTLSWDPALDFPPYESYPRGMELLTPSPDPHEPKDPKDSWSMILKGVSLGITVHVLDPSLKPLDLALAFLLGLRF